MSSHVVLSVTTGLLHMPASAFINARSLILTWHLRLSIYQVGNRFTFFSSQDDCDADAFKPRPSPVLIFLVLLIVWREASPRQQSSPATNYILRIISKPYFWLKYIAFRLNDLILLPPLLACIYVCLYNYIEVHDIAFSGAPDCRDPIASKSSVVCLHYTCHRNYYGTQNYKGKCNN